MERPMTARTLTRTLFLATLMVNLGATGAWAQQTHVNMTFSGDGGPSTINLQVPGTVTGEEHVAGNGTLGSFTLRTVTATDATPSPQPPKSCSGPNQLYFTRTAGAGIFRFRDGSLLTVELAQGNDCIDLGAMEGHCTLILKINGGTNRFSKASGTLVFTETSKPVLADAFHQPVFFTEAGRIVGTVVGVAGPDESEDQRR
jgi:hypothetical protein